MRGLDRVPIGPELRDERRVFAAGVEVLAKVPAVLPVCERLLLVAQTSPDPRDAASPLRHCETGTRHAMRIAQDAGTGTGR